MEECGISVKLSLVVLSSFKKKRSLMKNILLLIKKNQPAGSIIVLKTENCDRWKDESVLVRDSYMG